MTRFYGHPARLTNIAPCITQVTFQLVHYALFINQLRFGLTFFKVLANFPTDKYRLDCGLELNAKVFQLHLNNVSGVLVLEGYDYSSHIISIFQKPAMASGQQLSS